MKRLRIHPAAIAFLLLAGCQASRPAGGGDIAGTYTLVKVDGSFVPAAVLHDGATMRVHSGTLRISADGTCVSTTVFAPPGSGPVTREARATYAREGERLTMQWEGAGVTEGAVKGWTFVMDNHGMIFEYSR